MGWSCNRDAGLRLDCLSIACVQSSGMSNTWVEGDKSYFFEIGRENSDGSITAVIWRKLSDLTCKKSGSLRIEPDGKISRGPSFLKKAAAYRIEFEDQTGCHWPEARPSVPNLGQELDSHNNNLHELSIPDRLAVAIRVYDIQTDELVKELRT